MIFFLFSRQKVLFLKCKNLLEGVFLLLTFFKFQFPDDFSTRLKSQSSSFLRIVLDLYDDWFKFVLQWVSIYVVAALPSAVFFNWCSAQGMLFKHFTWCWFSIGFAITINVNHITMVVSPINWECPIQFKQMWFNQMIKPQCLQSHTFNCIWRCFFPI